MPGFYFDAELDNVEALTWQLERAALRALSAPQDQIRHGQLGVTCLPALTVDFADAP
jgi:hypothetical protein